MIFPKQLSRILYHYLLQLYHHLIGCFGQLYQNLAGVGIFNGVVHQLLDYAIHINISFTTIVLFRRPGCSQMILVLLCVCIDSRKSFTALFSPNFTSASGIRLWDTFRSSSMVLSSCDIDFQRWPGGLRPLSYFLSYLKRIFFTPDSMPPRPSAEILLSQPRSFLLPGPSTMASTVISCFSFSSWVIFCRWMSCCCLLMHVCVCLKFRKRRKPETLLQLILKQKWCLTTIFASLSQPHIFLSLCNWAISFSFLIIFRKWLQEYLPVWYWLQLLRYRLRTVAWCKAW